MRGKRFRAAGSHGFRALVRTARRKVQNLLLRVQSPHQEATRQNDAVQSLHPAISSSGGKPAPKTMAEVQCCGNPAGTPLVDLRFVEETIVPADCVPCRMLLGSGHFHTARAWRWSVAGRRVARQPHIHRQVRWSCRLRVVNTSARATKQTCGHRRRVD